MSLPSLSAPSAPGPSTLQIPPLPVPQLESLKFKANQIIESIQALQWTIEAGGNPHAMPAWPDILSKYNVLLSQTHNFSNALVNPLPGQTARIGQGSGNQNANIYERIALHPGMGMPDSQLDGEVIPLLRNQQTTDVLRVENETVRRLAEHMKTRGSLGVLGAPPPPKPQAHAVHLNGFGGSAFQQKKPEYEDVLRECAEISGAHDRRVDRAVRAVTMLREKFDWKQRVEVEVEEPEELEWDPRLGRAPTEAPVGDAREGDDGDVGMDSGDDDDEGKGGSSDEDEVNVEGALVDSGGMEGQTPLSNGLFSEISPTADGNADGPNPGITTSATAGDVPMDGIQ